MQEQRTYAGYRDKMRDECVAMHAILLKRKRISITALAEELRISPRTVRRWVTSFSLVLPLRLERGVVIHDSGNPNRP